MGFVVLSLDRDIVDRGVGKVSLALMRVERVARTYGLVTAFKNPD